ncbi:hypothetical protein [Bifidobacterium sp. SO4]|uniref:hypothetical protein n=1 Tax=Bifidobacterium sp. SO4 TaxID=2809030 RepID=UPI001BDC4338|nr:hypothetical protein [Bifidobacterium sp. SO4]MBT1171230.1 hypothetical protein [Bifidobacterium sp. SO4]
MMLVGIVLGVLLLPFILFGVFLNTPVGQVVSGVIDWGLDHLVLFLVIVGVLALINLFFGEK